VAKGSLILYTADPSSLSTLLFHTDTEKSPSWDQMQLEEDDNVDMEG